MVYYLKGFLVLVWFFIACTVCMLISLVRFKNPTNGYIFAQIFGFGGTRLLGIKIQIRNKERLIENQPCIYIANHQSNADVLIHGCGYSPRTVMTGKKELVFIPLFGTLFYLAGNIMLDRKDKISSLKSMEKLEKHVKEKKLSVYVFPEGTRNHGASEMLPFKRGAFHLAVGLQYPLVPIICAPQDPFLDYKNHRIHTGTIPIQVLEPISTIGKTNEDIDQLILEARTKMQGAFDQLKAEVSQTHSVS